MNLAEARKMARTIKAEIALGIYPKSAVVTVKPVLTYATFFTDRFTLLACIAR